MLEPRTPIPWTPRTILHLAVMEDVDFAVLAANQHAKLVKALKHTQHILHGYACQEEADCLEACESARSTIEEAKGES